MLPELILCFVAAHTLGGAIQINYVKVPLAVKNDSKSPVVIDCNYSLRPDDTDLVVKWYLNDDLVYQWIPPQKPQSFGSLKDKLDLEYRATDDPKSAYRALKIYNPTNELAGEYKCYVSTFTDEDFSVKNMIVFVPEKSLDVWNSGSDDSTVNFTCMATAIYPIPKLIIYKDNSEEIHKSRLPAVHWDITKHPDGKYTVYVIASALIDTLEFGTIIRCELRIPATRYVKIGSLLYYPEGESLCYKSTLSLVLLLMNVLY